MKKRMLILVTVVGLMISCNPRKEEAAKNTIDSLRNELEQNRNMTQTMVEVGVLMDSIDANRNVLRTKMVEGTNYDSYVARMRDLNQYVKKTQDKLEALEKTARKSNNNNSSYTAAIKKLKADLEVRNHELIALTEQVNQYKNQNEELVRTVDLQKAEIEEKLALINTKQAETAQLQEQVNQLLIKSKLDEGEAYFARAMAVEETANRTHFAPKKKKNTLRQALDLYRMAETFGKDNAQPKVAALEARLGIKPTNL